MSFDPMGSAWRVWDLHFHTPASFDYQRGSVTPKDIADGLIASGVEVVAITDHHRIDPGFIQGIRDAAKERLTVLPGIEMRTDQGGDPIHYIGIFPEDRDVTEIWDVIKGKFELTPAGIKAKGGDDKVYVSIKTAAPVFRKLGGVISIHAGAKSNTIETIKNQEQFQQRIKYDIVKDSVDILEIGQLKDVHRYLNVVFPVTSLSMPIVIGSDCHDIQSYAVSCKCWIKADKSLRGLRQIIREPADRVYLGDEPRIIGRVRAKDEIYTQCPHQSEARRLNIRKVV